MLRGRISSKKARRFSFDAMAFVDPPTTRYRRWLSDAYWKLGWKSRLLTHWKVNHKRLRQLAHLRYMAVELALIGNEDIQDAMTTLFKGLPYYYDLVYFSSYREWKFYIEDSPTVLGAYTDDKYKCSEVIRPMGEFSFTDKG